MLGLHETVCSGAADGYGRMARIPAMTLLHLGPGLANGLCNFHNARRAGTPIVSLVGEMATWHKAADPLLNMNIESIAGTVSGHVRTCTTGDDLYAAMAEACLWARRPRAVDSSSISTLIVPHDLSWEKSDLRVIDGSYSLGSLSVAANKSQESEMVRQFVKDCAEALADRNVVLRAFYGIYPLFAYLCVGAELTWVALYVLAHEPDFAVGPLRLVDVTTYVFAPACVMKNVVNMAQFGSAAQNLAERDMEKKAKEA